MGFCQFFLNLRQAELVETKTDGLYHERHIQTELAHSLHTLFFTDDLAGSRAVSPRSVQVPTPIWGISKPLLSLIISVLLGLFINYPKSRYKDGANRTQKARFFAEMQPIFATFCCKYSKKSAIIRKFAI